MEVVAKPRELLALHSVTAELFETLKEWFDVSDSVALDLSDVDAAVAEMSDPQMIAALAMRKLQALHLLSTPGVRTSTDVVVTVVQDLTRALVQAPNMRLHRAVEHTDWDAALAELTGAGEEGSDEEGPGVLDADEDDPEIARFQELHAALHAAANAVLEVSEGEIVYLE